MIDARTAPYAALLLRAGLGSMLVAHGLLKVLVFTVPGTVAFFGQLGYPAALAYAVIAAELVGGVLLLLGVRVRETSLAMLPILLGATAHHLENGWLFSAAGGGWEFPAFWTLALLVQALLGPGAYALRLPAAGLRGASTAGAD